MFNFKKNMHLKLHYVHLAGHEDKHLLIICVGSGGENSSFHTSLEKIKVVPKFTEGN